MDKIRHEVTEIDYPIIYKALLYILIPSGWPYFSHQLYQKTQRIFHWYTRSFGSNSYFNSSPHLIKTGKSSGKGPGTPYGHRYLQTKFPNFFYHRKWNLSPFSHLFLHFCSAKGTPKKRRNNSTSQSFSPQTNPKHQNLDDQTGRGLFDIICV